MRRALIWTALVLTLACSESKGDGSGAGGNSGGSAGSQAGGSAGTQAGGSGGVQAGGSGGAETGGSGGSPNGGSAGTQSGGTGGIAGASGSGGSAGAESCAPVTLGSLIVADMEAGGSSLAYELLGLDTTLDDVLYVEFFDVAGAQMTGSFDLSQSPDDNYSSCAHCLLGFEDVGGSSTPFYPESGTLVVTQADTQYMGVSAGQFDKVILRESTLESSVTTPVQGGKCWLLSGGWSNP